MTTGQRDVLEEIGAWAHETFPRWSNGGIIEHIRRELTELEEDPMSGEEMADIVILLCHLAYEHDVNLMDAIKVKHVINQHRTWGEPDAQGVVEHVK